MSKFREVVVNFNDQAGHGRKSLKKSKCKSRRRKVLKTHVPAYLEKLLSSIEQLKYLYTKKHGNYNPTLENLIRGKPLTSLTHYKDISPVLYSTTEAKLEEKNASNIPQGSIKNKKPKISSVRYSLRKKTVKNEAKWEK